MSDEENQVLGRLIDQVDSLVVTTSRLDERSKFQASHNATTLNDLRAIKDGLSALKEALVQMPDLKKRIESLEDDSKKFSAFKNRTAPFITIAITLVSGGVLTYFGISTGA